MRFSSSNFRATAVALSFIATPLLAQSQPAIPPLQLQGAASYTCGGIGETSSKAMLAARKDYPLSMLFATASGEYNGTDRMRFDFEFNAGIFQTRLPRSICAQVACSASFSRQPVDSRNSATRQMVRFSSVRRTCNRRCSSASSR